MAHICTRMYQYYVKLMFYKVGIPMWVGLKLG